MLSLYFFFFNDPPTPEIYTLSLHDALPISRNRRPAGSICRITRPHRRESRRLFRFRIHPDRFGARATGQRTRSEEHTSELQSRRDLVCRLLLEKKKKKITNKNNSVKNTMTL